MRAGLKVFCDVLVTSCLSDSTTECNLCPYVSLLFKIVKRIIWKINGRLYLHNYRRI